MSAMPSRDVPTVYRGGWLAQGARGAKRPKRNRAEHVLARRTPRNGDAPRPEAPRGERPTRAELLEALEAARSAGDRARVSEVLGLLLLAHDAERNAEERSRLRSRDLPASEGGEKSGP